MQGDDGTVSVVANQLSDCLTLHTELIKPPDGLTLRVDLRLIPSHPEAVRPDTKSAWQGTIHYLLNTFLPASLTILVPEGGPRPVTTFCREMEDGSVYTSTWKDDKCTFVIEK